MARYTQDSGDPTPNGSQDPYTTPYTSTQTPTAPGPPGHDPNLDFGGTWAQVNGQWKFTPKNNDWQGWFQNLIHGQPSTSQGLGALKDVLTQYGLQLSPANAQGQTTKIGLPDGSWVRVLEGDPNSGSWTWVPQPTGGGTATIDPMSGVLTKPFGEQFQAPSMLDLGGPKGISYIPPAPQFTPPSFQQPTMEQALNEPGYQFALGQGVQGLDQSAAARGTLNTGGTLKDVLKYGQALGQQNYQNVFNRALDIYNTNYRGAYDAFQPLMAQWNTQAQAGQRQNELNYDQNWNQYLQRYNAYRNWQNDTFNKEFQTQTA